MRPLKFKVQSVQASRAKFIIAIRVNNGQLFRCVGA